jgi:hypothetical protein
MTMKKKASIKKNASIKKKKTGPATGKKKASATKKKTTKTSKKKVVAARAAESTATPAEIVTDPDPIGSCEYPNASGGLDCRDNIRQSECKQYPGSVFTVGGQCR